MNASTLQEIVIQYPQYTILAALGAAVLIVIIVFLILNAGRKKILKQSLNAIHDELLPDMESFQKQFLPSFLYRNSAVVENLGDKNIQKIVEHTGYDQIWIDKFRKHKRQKDFERILKYASKKGLFDCFITALQNKKAAGRLITWMNESEEQLPLRRLAVSSSGKDFDGRIGLELLTDYIDHIRELTGDPEWYVRLFAVRLLLHDHNDRSVRALREALHDSHYKIRMLIVSEFKEKTPEHHQELYENIYRTAISDPVEVVRQTAWKRIQKDFDDIHTVDTTKLSESEILHVIKLLKLESEKEEALAFPYLEHDNLEIRFEAARYLARAGALKRLLLRAIPSDPEDVKRVTQLLTNAAELGITGFFNILETPESGDSTVSFEQPVLTVCASILSSYGPISALNNLCKIVFSLPVINKEDKQLYQLTVTAACSRGDNDTLQEIANELQKQKENSELSTIILGKLPQPVPENLLPYLFAFFKDPAYSAEHTLHSVLMEAEQSKVIIEMFQIINTTASLTEDGKDYESLPAYDTLPQSGFQSDIRPYSQAIRLRALKLLVALKLSFCLQTIIENLYLLPVEDINPTANVLAEYPSKILSTHFINILDSDDARIRASIIRVLPIAGGKEFNKYAKEAVTDADPDVRVAGVWALVDYGDLRALNKAIAMLRDPVERVRIAAARAIGANGSDDLLQNLNSILEDNNEVSSVRKAAVAGLEKSSSLLSIDILTDKLENEETLIKEITVSLSKQTERKLLSRLIENFKDASPQLRDRLIAVYKHMGEDGEAAIEALLREDIPSIKPLAAEILEKTGFIEKQVRALSHREPEVRKKAADFLSHAGTKAAFRGMVMAAQDPDEEVRIMVIKALERLESGEEKEILETLENDPDQKVRTYTAWAMERIRAKDLK